MFELVAITAPIFLMVAVGYISVFTGYFPKEGIRFLGIFLINFALPAAIFKALGSRDLNELLHFDFLLVYGLASFLAFACLYAFAVLMRSRNQKEAAVIAMGGSFSNTLMLGFPILTFMLGEAALVPLSLAVLVENMVIMPLTLAIAENGRVRKKTGFWEALGLSLKSLLQNPIFIALIAGLFASLVSLPLPQVFMKIVDLLSSVVAGMALFAVGGMLVGLKLKGMRSDIYAIVASKLLLHPLIVVCLIWLVPPLPESLRTAAIILAALPMLSSYAIIGQRFGVGQLCSAALLPSVVLSSISVSFLTWWLA